MKVSRLTFRRIRAAHRRAKGKLPYKELARRFCVSSSTVSRAIHRREGRNVGQGLRESRRSWMAGDEILWKIHPLRPDAVINNYG